MREFYRCPKCGRDNSIKPLLDQPCGTRVTPPAECSHGEPEGECASCAACAACRGECGVCPYVTPPGLPLHRTEAGWPNCSTCDGGGCLDCTDPA